MQFQCDILPSKPVYFQLKHSAIIWQVKSSKNPDHRIFRDRTSVHIINHYIVLTGELPQMGKYETKHWPLLCHAQLLLMMRM